MEFSFKALSLSYQHAPIHVRESLAFNEHECKALLVCLSETLPATDILMLSTCNRTEVYYRSERDCTAAIIERMARQKGIAEPAMLTPYFQVMTDAETAMVHLFHVAMGLESQVVGDLHIANQVKRAYQFAVDVGTAGPFLHRLMHTIFSTSKRVAQETAFRDGAASVSYATVELVRQLTAAVAHPSILLIGLGEIGTDVCKNLSKARAGAVSVVNRTAEKSLALSTEYPVDIVAWHEVAERIPWVDVVISAVPGLQPFLTKESLATSLEKRRHASATFFIDLSIPRSIDPGIQTLAGVHLFNIDDIRNRASEAVEKRKAAIPRVRELVAEALSEFRVWANEAAFSPVIQAFKATLDQIRQQEISRYAKQLTEEEARRMELLTQGIIQKILKQPVLQLKTACQRGEAEQLCEVLQTLFNLKAQPEEVPA